MNKEVLISMVNSGKIRFIPLRRCSLCNEYIGYKFVRMYDGNTIPVFSSGCRCCGINIGSLSERTWDEVLDDDVNKMASQMVYLMNNYPDFVEIGRWWISKKTVMSWVPKGKAVDGSGWIISFTLSFGLEGGTQIRFDKEDEYLSEIDRLNELFNVIL